MKKVNNNLALIRRLLCTTVFFMILFVFAQTSSFASIDYSGDPVNVTFDSDNTGVILTFDFLNADGSTINVTSPAAVTINTISIDDYGITCSGDTYGQLTFETSNSTFIESLSGGSSHTLIFPATTIDNGTIHNTEDINLTFTMPSKIIGMTTVTSSSFGTTLDFDTPSGNVTLSYFNKSDFNDTFTNSIEYMSILATDIQSGVLQESGPEQIETPLSDNVIDATTKTYKFSTPTPGTQYAILATTRTPSSGGDVGAAVYTSYVNFAEIPSATNTLDSGIYDTGSSDAIENDDKVILTFSEAITNPGSAADYSLWIDNDSDGSLDYALTETDYSVALSGPNVVITFEAAGVMDTKLIDTFGDKLKVEVSNPTGLTPAVNSASDRVYIPITGRYPYASVINFTDNTNINVLSIDTHIDDSDLYPKSTLWHKEAISNAAVSVDLIDPNAQLVTPVDLTVYTYGIVGDVIVKAADGYLTHTYHLSIDVLEDFLYTLKYNDIDLPGFSPYVENYNVTLPAGTTTPPSVVGAFHPDYVLGESINLPAGESYATIDYQTSGDLSSTYTVTAQVSLWDPDFFVHRVQREYTIDFTVEASNTPTDDNTDNTTETTDTSTTSSSDSSSKKKKKNDEQVTSEITTETGSLLDVVASTTSIDGETEDTLEQTTQNIISLIEKIETASGARIVLNQLPNTLEDLLEMKEALNDLDAEASMDADIAALIAETERLIALLSQGRQSQEQIEKLMTPLSDYYKTIDQRSQASKEIMLNSIDISNTAIEQVGTVHLNWTTVDIRDGRVYLAPNFRDITQAARQANQMETNMEGLLTESLTGGLENGIISTVTIAIPDDLKNASQTGVSVDQDLIKSLKDNEIERLNLNLGAIAIGIDNRFLDAHEDTNFEFNVDNQGQLSEEEKKELPKDTSSIGAPVIDVTAKQNNEEKDDFRRPLELVFDLNALGYEGLHADKLFIARQNPETNTWEKVGGWYDPVTNTIRTNRMHLSKYTVLKSEKNYSNIEDSWAKNEIASLKGKGIIDEQSLFNGNENISREEFACWVSKAYGLDATSMNDDMTSLDKNSAYYKEIQSLYDSAVMVSGNPTQHLETDQELSRQELAVLIGNALETYDRPVDTNTFELAQFEEDLPEWAVGSAETLIENGIADESYIGSSEPVTKEEAAAILYQVYR